MSSSNPELTPDDKNDPISIPEKPVYKVTERKYENYVKTGCSDFDAFQHFGITSWDEVEPSEVTKSEEVVRTGVSVDDLAKRAIFLTLALDKHLEASKLYSHSHKKEEENDYNFATNLIEKGNRLVSEGNRSFSKAYGVEEMGNSEDIRLKARDAARDFYKDLTGSANKKHRNKFRKNLEWQIK